MRHAIGALFPSAASPSSPSNSATRTGGGANISGIESDSVRSPKIFQREAPPMIGERREKTTLAIRLARIA